MMSKSRRNDRGSKHNAEEPPKMIEDLDTMLESHRKDKGSRHDAREPLKRKRIRTRCQRVVEKIRDPSTMSENR